MPIQVFNTSGAQPEATFSASSLLNRWWLAVVLIAMCLLTATAMASQVVGEVTLTIGKSKIERAAGESEPQNGGSV